MPETKDKPILVCGGMQQGRQALLAAIAAIEQFRVPLVEAEEAVAQFGHKLVELNKLNIRDMQLPDKPLQLRTSLPWYRRG